MKHMPNMRSPVCDETLNFCLDDGERLSIDNVVEDYPTQAMPGISAGDESSTRVFDAGRSGVSVSAVTAPHELYSSPTFCTFEQGSG
jgi:hypothetical protein